MAFVEFNDTELKTCNTGTYSSQTRLNKIDAKAMLLLIHKTS